MGGVAFVGMRISGLMIFAPFLGSLSIPVRLKAGLSLALTAALYPSHAARIEIASPMQWMQVAGGEFLIGLLVGLSANFVFEGAQLAGHILGVQMGYSLVSVLDPQTQIDTPVLSLFHQTLALLIFLRLNVHHWLLRAVSQSFDFLPPGPLAIRGPMVVELFHTAGSLWLLGLEIAAPVLVATVLVDIALAFVGKASPNLPILFIGLSVKNVVGLFVLGSSLALWPTLFEGYFANGLQAGERLLHLAR